MQPFVGFLVNCGEMVSEVCDAHVSRETESFYYRLEPPLLVHLLFDVFFLSFRCLICSIK